MENKKQLPLRIGVGIALLNNENKIFVGKRIDNPANSWQMPQGGVDENEDFLINTTTDNQLNYAIKLFVG